MQRFNSSVNCANISNRECSNALEHIKHCQTSQSTAKQNDTPYLLIHCGDDDNFDNDIHCEHAVSLHNHYIDCADTHSLVNHPVNFRNDQNKNNDNKDKEKVDITKKIIISPTITEIDHGQSSGSLANIFHLSHKLGDGAFGSVWHGKSKLDSQSYAIKIIPYLVDNENEQQQAETFREVRTMAKMESHSCVVRYYTSWIEEMQPFVYDKIKDIDAMQANKYMEEDCDDQSSISHDLWSNAALSMDHQISLESIIDNNDENNKDLENISDAKTHSSLTPNVQPFALPNRVLIIQMELCENGTLRDWLSSRKSVNYIQSLQIFRQIVEALHHIHCYDVLHRDVKPSNVFLCKNDRIKLGDFGLSIFQKHRDLSSNSKEISRDCDDTVSSNNNIKGNDLTFGLGTHTYGAPEQLNSVKLKNKQTYSKQADIYPLGLIAYELLNTFSTGMERVICINELKNTQKTSDQFRQKYNRMAYLIEAMISLKAQNRPTTNDILEVLNLEWTEHQIEMPMFSRNNSMSLSMRSSVLEFAADLNSSSNFKHLSKHSSFVFNECKKVKELEQELIAKDEQIEFLMERISKLEMEKMTQ